MIIDVGKAQNETQDPKGMLSPPPPTSTSVRNPNVTDVDLMPSRNPPKWAMFDIFPFSLLVNLLTDQGKQVQGKKAARRRAKRGVMSHNIPLEITLYLVSHPICLLN
jgi:ion channel-forming bestrophin family protein